MGTMSSQLYGIIRIERSICLTLYHQHTVHRGPHLRRYHHHRVVPHYLEQRGQEFVHPSIPSATHVSHSCTGLTARPQQSVNMCKTSYSGTKGLDLAIIEVPNVFDESTAVVSSPFVLPYVIKLVRRSVGFQIW